MKSLFAPWRSDYIKGVRKHEDGNNKCVFCITENNHDENQLVLGQYKHCNVIMNLYPYSAGHLLITPKRHIAELQDLNPEELNELMFLTKEATRILKDKVNAEGINVGMNLGSASGAGIPEHLHMHVLPRWIGDTGFLCSIANTRVISIDLQDAYNDLKPEFDKIKT
jgi:ATP adenylyltransferase